YAAAARAIVVGGRVVAHAHAALTALPGRAGHAAVATILIIDVEVDAGSRALERCHGGTAALTERTDLIGAAVLAAGAAVGRIVFGYGFAIADLAVVDEPVALVVDPVAAHLFRRIRDTSADLGA